MTEVYIAYVTDPRHSYFSRDLIGISESWLGLLDLMQKKALKEDGKRISTEQIWNLTNIFQTQGYDGENIGEFDTEIIELNKLI